MELPGQYPGKFLANPVEVTQGKGRIVKLT